MKKIIFLLISILLTVSCSKTEVLIIERVPCTFHPSQFKASVDEAPFTKVGEYTEAYYIFTSPKDTITGSAVIGLPFSVDLVQNTTYELKMIANTASESNLLGNPAIIINNPPTVFNTIETITVQETPINKAIVLKHLAGQFIAKVGKIPSGFEVVLDTKRVADQYNWLTTNISYLETVNRFSASTETLWESYVIGGSIVEIYVGIRRVNSTDEPKKFTLYKYPVTKATIKTVVFNINNVQGDDSFSITIDETLEQLTEENQQIGKPQ